MAKPTKVQGLFASGIAAPFRGDSDGGVAIQEGDDYIRDQVFACVQPNNSDNPFQDFGDMERPVFENPTDPGWRRVIRQRIVENFGFLESNNLARLVKVEFDGDADENGDYGCVIHYLNIETNSEQSATVPLLDSTGRPLRPI